MSSLLLLVFVAAQSAALFPSGPEGPAVLYFVSAPTPVRAAPSAGAKTTGRLQPFDVVTGRVSEGWLEIELSSGGVEQGWIPLVDENIVDAPLETLKRRVFHVRQARWPDRVKLDVARGRIRPGFTADQVQLALGDPIAKELVQTGDSVTELWIYQDRRIAFSHTGVRDIQQR